MHDQAEALRLKMMNSQRQVARSIAVISGKGGVGKSNFTANFSYALVAKGKKVLIVDMDIGMGNIHILFGATPTYHLKDYLTDQQQLQKVVTPIEENLAFIAGGSGLENVVEWSGQMFDRLIEAFSVLQTEYDVILFDMGAGATKSSIDLILAMDEVILIATPEPTSITDAYSMIKFICLQDTNKTIHIVSNRVLKEQDGRDSVARLQLAIRKFLSMETSILGFLPDDIHVRNAVIAQVPFVKLYPNAKVSKRMMAITDTFLHNNKPSTTIESSGFIDKIKGVFLKGRV
ncbi:MULTISPECIES: MinD/ParA family protein [unclassified Sporosarcina]|uniref:MinD/ParA family protein n=1 Tax=unclassified Sporosarcina TaxID=2647733 RepID=UPI000C16E1B6|nr:MULTISPECIES: MinD/ParA family protein [unclassified Sporosarcina]PID00178.1 ATPase [Sporosarcina sp. P29]PID06862.1 ATPase [Sporosarcina sp. P30]PID10056.1 ATPase [Sporosarcina sp. P31]PID13635.1 ATPase [Sporosarcina sp. P32b]